MVQGATNKKYTQPYNSSHVIKNTQDPIRSDEPAYIKNFPRFLNMLYKKQTPFHIDLLVHYRPVQDKPTPITTRLDKNVEKTLQSIRQTAIKSQQKQGFKTLIQNQQEQQEQPEASVKNTNQLTALPSDFEHIFHYSETQ